MLPSVRLGLSAAGLAAALVLPAAAPAYATAEPATRPTARPISIGDCAEQGVRRGSWHVHVHSCLVGVHHRGKLTLAGRTTVTAGQPSTRVSVELVRLGVPGKVLTEDTRQHLGPHGKVGPVSTKYVRPQGCEYRVRANYSVRWPDHRLSRYTTLTPAFNACLPSSS